MGKHRCAVLALSLLAAMTLAGCAQGQNAAQPGGIVSTSPTPDATPSPSTPGSTQTPPAGSDPTGTGGPGLPGGLTIRGLVHDAGVENDCFLLDAENNKSYLLLGGDRQLISAGGRLEVVGQPQPGLMTTCQVGIPFLVSKVQRI